MSVAEPPSLTPVPLSDEPGGPGRRPRIKKLRLALILLGLSLLALVSTVFGMMMAVASDLPSLENDKRFNNARNSVLLDRRNRRLGVLVNNQNLVFVRYDQISPAMRYAIIAIEDRRFFTNSGIDIRGIGRAFLADVFSGGPTQGGSTITQQFVKNALAAQNHRTVFQKLREAALAYHLTRKWSKEKILTQYLNTIYFGNGAYGIESAARVYFGTDHPGCGQPRMPPCASQLRPEEAALLAGMVSNPSGFDPTTRWRAAMARRNLVLETMRGQGYLTRQAYDLAVSQTAPPVVRPPQDLTTASDPNVGYFNTWVRQQLVDLYRDPQKVFRGGLRVRTTLDLDFQRAAEQAVRTYLPGPAGPTAALVAIDNATGEVRAMVGGPDYLRRPFNLATQGQRQPGSAFKPFVLAAALRKGISPSSTWASRRKVFTVPGTRGKEKFVVNNYEGSYSGVTTLARATTVSDNSVYAEVGYRTGFRRIASMARSMGIRTPVSTNPAISLGGLKQGVTVLDMAHAYETLARGGMRVEGSLGAPNGGPVGIAAIEDPNGEDRRNRPRLQRVVSKQLADVEVPILASVVSSGTGTRAQIPGVLVAGKTGTTESYGDAWFVGFTDKWTVAVWVGYPDRLKSMKTEFQGQPVAGGTFPALIWRQFVVEALRIEQERANAQRAKSGLPPTAATTTPAAPATGQSAPTTTTPAAGGAAPTSTTGTGNSSPPARKPPAPKPAPAPATPPPGTGGGDTGGASPAPGATPTTPAPQP